MWDQQKQNGSEAERSDRVRVESHKQAEPTWTAFECYSTGPGRRAPLRSRFCFCWATKRRPATALQRL